MSLINDALKRASQAKKEQASTEVPTPHSAAAAPPMQATEHRRSSSIPIIVPVLIIFVLFVAGAVVTWKLLASKSQSGVQTAAVAPVPKAVAPVAAPTPPVAAPVASAKVEPKPLPVAAPLVETPKVATPVAVAATVTPSPATATAATPTPQPEVVVAAPVVPAVPTFPAIKLQGIFYRKINPTVMLNGKSLAVGGKIDGAIVTKIEQASVTLEWNGETKTLELQ